MYKYRNVSDMDQSVVGLGLVPAGKEFETNVKIESSLFEEVGATKQPAPEPPVETKNEQEEDTE